MMQKAKSWLQSNKPRGATRGTGTSPKHHGVWLFALVAGLTTVTIASIPSRDEARPHYTPGMPLTPPEQIVTSVGLQGEPQESRQAAAAALLADYQNSISDTADSTVIAAKVNEAQWQRVRVRRGDTLLRILHKQKLANEDINAIIRSNPKPLYRLIPGQTLSLRNDDAGRLQEIKYQVDLGETISLLRQDDGEFVISKAEREFDTRMAYITGRITSSLFADGQAAGLSDAHIIRLAEIFGWDVDFSLGVYPGDSFAVIHEEKYWLGQKVADGPILAAEFINRGKIYRAIAHRDEAGNLRYFTPQGDSMRRAFLRSPVKFGRISSRFTKRRYHPVLKRWRAHKGVDYAASTGTPVRATASGRVIHVGRKGGYGKTIMVKHGGVYSTLYAHLSRYSRLRVGGLVQQGQIIGYVGKTGLATGPHLHYEFRVHDQHRNPLAYRFPKAQPIAGEYKSDFLSYAGIWSQKLDLIGRSNTVQVASNN